MQRGVFTEYSWTIGKVTQDDFNSTWYLYAINVYGNTTITIKVIPAQGICHRIQNANKMRELLVRFKNYEKNAAQKDVCEVICIYNYY